MASLLGRSAHALVSPCARPRHALAARPQLQQPKARLVRAAPEGEQFENFEDIDWTEDLPTPVRRRVAALREVQTKQDEVTKVFVRERAELEAKFQQQLAPLWDERASVVSGKKEVGAYDIPDSEEEDTGIPEFWLTAMTNHEMVGELITERDAEVLAHLTDVRVVSLTGEDAGSFRITFAFSDNAYFANKTLEKTFYMEDPDEVVPRKFVGTQIEWQSGKDTTVTVVKKRVADKKGGKGRPTATINKTEPCDSFFNFFRTPVVPENPDDLSEEDLEALQEQMDEDYEVGVAFKESLIPRAVEWFTGEAAPPLYDDDYEGDGEGEFVGE
ncbi:MAG: nucleosome assembly protein-domain-containing protein [Monoraphidium minutum]|nr:MAG: nucleosome assembly protein-domain-containing protein [Monoraphidium minutum]